MDPIRIRIRHAYRYQYISLIHPLFCHFANNVLQITTTLFPQPLSQCGVFCPGGGGCKHAIQCNYRWTNIILIINNCCGPPYCPRQDIRRNGMVFCNHDDSISLSLSLSLCTGQYTVKKKIFSCTQKACWPGYQKSPAVPE